MKVVFYSDHCEYSNKLLAYLDKHNIKSLFKLICIDNIEPPKEIDIVPTIIDDMLNQPLKGKKAFEYLLNLKYFNNPTNNIELVKDIPSNPDIPEDEKAQKDLNTTNLEITTEKNIATTFHEENKTGNVAKSTQQMVNLRSGQDKMFSLLMRMRR
jgi:hypothetical protein